jgi:outer membrane lipopolysaccharide assembly protein LptE/RlpB
MKKILTALAMVAMVVGLTGCLDDPDGSQQRLSHSTSVTL